jgi:hypothetical protein
VGNKEYFKGVPKIAYEGKASDNPLAFKYYNPDQVVAGKTMREHFKFAIAYWHSFCGQGSDPFGPGTQNFPWDQSNDPVQAAKDKADAAFEFISKMGFDYFCFHDYDLIQEGSSLAESEKRLTTITDYIKTKQDASGINLLWGTANCFSNPRYMNGAATNPDFDVVAHAGAQVKLALDATMKLNGENYVFWGGREGYISLLNTDMGREQDHMARFLTMAKDYARAQGFTGTFFIEPKPSEPVLSMNLDGSDVTVHPVGLSVDDVPWAKSKFWAPDAAYKDGTYYLYYPAKDADNIFRLGVAISDKPEGPFTPQPEPMKGSYSIDPAVFTDDDGSAYIYFGGIWGGQLQRWESGVYDENGSLKDMGVPENPAILPRIAKLSDDMLEFAEEIKQIEILDKDGNPILTKDLDRRFFEAPWIHKHNGTYYISYSTGDTHLLAYATGDPV